METGTAGEAKIGIIPLD